MSSLAEDSIEGVSWRRWARRALVALLVIAGVLAAGWQLRKLVSGGDAPKRQVARIVLLPDTPPPPPPREQKRPEPKEERPQNQPQPKPEQAPPQPSQQVREEGPTGDAAGGIAGGTVTREGVPPAPVTGGASSGSGTSSDRAQERFYANTARQLLRDAMERNLKSEATQLSAEFSVWLAADGAIQRFELAPSGNPRTDADLRAALDDTARSLKLPPPPAMAQPMRFRVTVRPLG